MTNEVNGMENRLIQKISDYVDEDIHNGHIPQPMVIVGSSGSGKTTLMRLLVDRFEKDERNGRVLMLDGRQFFSSAEIIHAVEDACPEESCGGIGNCASDRRIVIIDDIDFYFNRSQFDDQYQLRNYLHRENAPLLIATVSEIGKSLADYKAPFFEGVRLIYIPPFDDSMLSGQKLPADKYNRMTALMKYLPPVVRSYNLASDIVAVSDNEEADMTALLNIVSPIYRSIFEGQPVNSQRILNALANSSAPMTLTELRLQTGLPSGTLSTYLRQLVSSGVIIKTFPGKRGTPYEIKDILFKIWLSEDV